MEFFLLKRTSRAGMDKDFNKSDVKKCPEGWNHRGWKTFDLALGDHYLRVCGNRRGHLKSCDKYIDLGWSFERRGISEHL